MVCLFTINYFYFIKEPSVRGNKLCATKASLLQFKRINTLNHREVESFLTSKVKAYLSQLCRCNTNGEYYQ